MSAKETTRVALVVLSLLVLLAALGWSISIAPFEGSVLTICVIGFLVLAVWSSEGRP